MKKWFHIKGKDKSIYKPEGKVLSFWLWGESKKDIRELVIKKGYQNIEWIREETPPFI